MFITVRDRGSRDLYDIDERSFREDAHERVKDRPARARPGRAKARNKNARPVNDSPVETDSDQKDGNS